MAHVIRLAKSEDCDDIVRLIKELAEYEKLADQVRITPEVLRRDGFGDEPFYRCFVVEIENAETGVKHIVGYALYCFYYSTFEGRSLYLEDIYVSPDYRGRGIGTQLWKRVGQVAVEKECQRMDFVVLDWNKRAQDLYHRHGAYDKTARDGWHLYRMDGEALKTFGTPTAS